MKKIDIVLGLGFGDEGKGRLVHKLATPTSLVVRFNGGSNAGHTVKSAGRTHVFSSIASGMLKDAASYFSEHTYLHPGKFMSEFHKLELIMGQLYNKYNFKMYVNQDAKLITPFDEYLSRKANDGKNGTTGVGLNQAIIRNNDHYHLSVGDLRYPVALKYKIKMIEDEYIGDSSFRDDFILWYNDAIEMAEKIIIVDSMPNMYGHIIFEGAQGIMLDQHYGFFPYVTRSNTTSKNVRELIFTNLAKEEYSVVTHYVTRSYATRHGDGPLPNEHRNTEFIDKSVETTNVDNKYQGKFRYAPLTLDILKYAHDMDRSFNDTEQRLWVNFANMDETFPIIINGKVEFIDGHKLAGHLGIDTTSYF